MLLAIDTSTRYAGVALSGPSGEAGSGGGVRTIYGHSWYSAHNHTVELMPAVSRALTGQGLAVKDLSGVAVALGPGGFSAIRVGISTAKGLALPLKLPLVGVGTLELEAYAYAGVGLPVRPLIDAGRGEVATALFKGPRSAWGKLEEERVCSIEELAASVFEPTLLCGEGVQSRGSHLLEALGDRVVLVDGYTPTTRLWSLGAVSGLRLGRGEADDPGALQPMYLRRPSIGQPRVPRTVNR
jgi:tRNA threonylcarbamoyladenosine biosynthesis protein TsaB